MDSRLGQVQTPELLVGPSALCYLVIPDNPKPRPQPLLTGSIQQPWHPGPELGPAKVLLVVPSSPSALQGLEIALSPALSTAFGLSP